MKNPLNTQPVKIGLFARLKLAWCAFRLKRYSDYEYLPYQIMDRLQSRTHYDCDIKGCKNCQKYCMSRGELFLIVGLNQDEHLHVCEDHAEKLKGEFRYYGGLEL